ncbi:MAG: hypothetical protein RJA36_3401 [Pseudomonadota bacterium]|jgi:hypothetical protein
MSRATDMRVIVPVTLTDAMLTSSSVAETDHTAWSNATAYSVADRVRYVATDVHKIWECIQAHTNKDPTSAANAAYWSEVSPTNRWKMFDQASGTSTTATTEIDVVLEPGRIDALALFDVDAHTVRVRMTTVAEGTFYDQTWTMTGAGDAVADWYEYFYSEIGVKTTLVVTELPPIGDAEVRVTITRTGGSVSCGNLVVGMSTVIGEAQVGARPGIIDYSRKETDDWGRTELVQRSFAKRMGLSVRVERARIDTVLRKLSALRATLGVWCAGSATTSYEALQIFGWFRDFDCPLTTPDYSFLSLEIEGIA